MPQMALALLAFPLLADAVCAKKFAQCYGDWQFGVQALSLIHI